MTIICIICLDDLSPKPVNNLPAVNSDTVIATLCGHLFHKTCLKRAFEASIRIKQLESGNRNKGECLTCKTAVKLKNIVLIYPAEQEEIHTSHTENKTIQTLTKQLEELTKVNSSLQNQLARMQSDTTTTTQKPETPFFIQRRKSSVSKGLESPHIIVGEADATESGVKLGKRIVWLPEQTETIESGTIRWLGQINDENFAGIEFDNPIGDHFPEAGGKTLFSCEEYHGRLVPVKEVMLFSDLFRHSSGNVNEEALLY